MALDLPGTRSPCDAVAFSCVFVLVQKMCEQSEQSELT
jgi:hypothetical protein